MSNHGNITYDSLEILTGSIHNLVLVPLFYLACFNLGLIDNSGCVENRSKLDRVKTTDAAGQTCLQKQILSAQEQGR